MERLTYTIVYICMAIAICIGLYVSKNPLCLFAFWLAPPCRFWMKSDDKNGIDENQNKRL